MAPGLWGFNYWVCAARDNRGGAWFYKVWYPMVCSLRKVKSIPLLVHPCDQIQPYIRLACSNLIIQVSKHACMDSFHGLSLVGQHLHLSTMYQTVPTCYIRHFEIEIVVMYSRYTKVILHFFFGKSLVPFYTPG